MLAVCGAIEILLRQVQQAVLQAKIELPLIPHLNTEFIVQTEIEALQASTKDIGLNLCATHLLDILTQYAQCEVGAQRTNERHIARKGQTITKVDRQLQIAQI